MKTCLNSLVGALLIISFVSSAVIANEPSAKKSSRATPRLVISGTAWGPSQRDLDDAKRRTEASREVQSALSGSNYRLLSFETFDKLGLDKSLPSPPPTHYRAIYYNYVNDTVVIAEADLAGRERLSVTTDSFDPGVTPEEIGAGIDIVLKDSGFSSHGSKNETYAPMPPTSYIDGERLVNIGVRSVEGDLHQIVGVSFKRGEVVRYPNDAPESAPVSPESCGIPSAGQSSTGQGLAGQAQIVINEENSPVPVWEMLVIRPSSSSGRVGERSGVEVRDVKYRGKSVMKRGHVPILNVKYINNACGPFRDWQYSEGPFMAPAEGATNPAAGIRILAEGQIATTSVETRNDFGNFQGVAVYQQDVGNGPEVVMVSELNAGWYRYIMEWRFGYDGTIRPRFGFASITSSCVCAPRNHHVYWRFDMDVVQPQNKAFRMERGRKFLTPLNTETSFLRSYGLNRAVLVQNGAGDEAYQIVPGLNDSEAFFSYPGGPPDPYGHGDFWILRFQGTASDPGELDDPNGSSSAANIAPWVNGESINDQDVVIWYAAHQYRVDDASFAERHKQEVITGRHVVGPELRPVRW
ncbi:MAG: hypothetical protein H0V76_07825 [Blastocatellia bacterium]|nr:hypothetical protein [Blastocatellia bacterium]